MIRRSFRPVKPPPQEPEPEPPTEPEDADTTSQVAAISEPVKALSVELERRIQKVKLQHHALQRRLSPPGGMPAAIKKT